ncbi:hypothetical protein HH214_16340 [Mucilaginibacter robiniae]|uniref:Uncharacterized protein n=1 Tax=Mucilaginibacter robiniae TaxID=2728022 RepID=A0A7L5E6C6_9SPHI|nr:hypothetical protein [Mucilaginibacter robiniae]QJD97324.1 hypothetical protein HH214_16340 [Mucilaginibacter robiniae]
MNKQSNLLDIKSAKQMVAGLILMTVFTLLWNGIAYYGLRNSPYRWLLSVFLIACIFFVYYAFQLHQAAQRLPVPDTSFTDQQEVKRREKLFMMICTGEGIGVFLAVNIVANLHHPELQVPAIALAVGLHFFPLAKVFKRKMDIYIGIWSTLVALLAIMLTLNHTISQMPMLVFTGVGLALSTSFYGIYMILKARRASVHQSQSLSVVD